MPEKDIIQEIRDLIKTEVEEAFRGVSVPDQFDLNLVGSPDIKVEMPTLDLSKLEKLIADLVNSKKNIPEQKIDVSKIENTLSQILNSIIPPVDNTVELRENKELLRSILDGINSNRPEKIDLSSISEVIPDMLGEVISELRNIRFKPSGGGGTVSSITLLGRDGLPVEPSISFEDGEAVTREGDPDGTDPSVTLVGGVDEDNKARLARMVGADSDLLATNDENSYILKDVLVELKIISKHLELLTEAQFEANNIEE